MVVKDQDRRHLSIGFKPQDWLLKAKNGYQGGDKHHFKTYDRPQAKIGSFKIGLKG